MTTPTKNSQLNREPLIRKARFLCLFTIVYNIIEGLVSVSLGVSDDSIALAGFGFDSLIEVASAVLVLWRLQAIDHPEFEVSLQRERFATKGIGILFLALATGTLLASGFQLWQRNHPDTTFWGLIVSTLSLSFMFYLWRAKRKVGLALDSKTILKDADCSLACIKLSFILFAGSLLFMVLPQLWWVDSVAAIALSIIIGREGWETIEAAARPDFDGGCGCG